MATHRVGTELNICTRCILPETFPGIQFDKDGVCNHCHREEKKIQRALKKKAEYRNKLDQLVNEVKGKAPVYDAIVAYSGGKDSSYTMKILRDEYDLRLLGMTFDNHFISPAARENMNKVTNALQVDLLIFKPSWPVIKRMFCCTANEDIFSRATLLRASAVCTACIGMVKSLVLKTGLEMDIPLVGFGWSPGQAPIQSAIMKTNPALVRQNQGALKRAFPGDIIEKLQGYFIPETYYETYKHRFPHNIHPLAFFDYDEDHIKRELDQLGWRIPSDTDTNSTNCLLNAFANQCHIQRHHFHPYVWEIANMVRQGIMSREEGIEKIYSDQNQEMVEYARNKLEL